MANRRFATTTYPTFGTSKRPKAESAWKSSVYYWWWEYLRRNAGYQRCCDQNGKGKYAALYKDFGDVHAVDFKTWWNEGNRGGVLFAEPAAEILFGELTYEEVRQLDEWSKDAIMIVRIPLTQSKRHLAKRFNTLLKRRHSGERGKRLLTRSAAIYPLAAQFRIDSLKASLAAYDMRKGDPKRPLWRVAIDTGLAPTVCKELKEQRGIPDLDQRNSLCVAASRAVKRATAMIENAGKGIFPKG
jgi:hypothetical protein